MSIWPTPRNRPHISPSLMRRVTRYNNVGGLSEAKTLWPLDSFPPTSFLGGWWSLKKYTSDKLRMVCVPCAWWCWSIFALSLKCCKEKYWDQRALDHWTVTTSVSNWLFFYNSWLSKVTISLQLQYYLSCLSIKQKLLWDSETVKAVSWYGRFYLQSTLIPNLAIHHRQWWISCDFLN